MLITGILQEKEFNYLILNLLRFQDSYSEL